MKEVWPEVRHVESKERLLLSVWQNISFSCTLNSRVFPEFLSCAQIPPGEFSIVANPQVEEAIGYS